MRIALTVQCVGIMIIELNDSCIVVRYVFFLYDIA